MKKSPITSPFIPYDENSIENVTTDITFLFNDDVISNNSPYNQQKETSNPNHLLDHIKVCYEIGNSAEIEDSSNNILEDDILM